MAHWSRTVRIILFTEQETDEDDDVTARQATESFPNKILKLNIFPKNMQTFKDFIYVDL